MIKNYFFIISLSMYVFSNLHSQCQSTGNVWLDSQEKLEDFAYIYSVTGCDTIKGNLIIGTYDDIPVIESLSSLSIFKVIKGDLYIRKTLLKNLDGLHNINKIEGKVVISFNEQLENLSGFPEVNNLYESIRIEDNDTLFNLTGLENIDSISGGLNIQKNKNLKQLDGLHSLTLCKSLLIEENSSLENLIGLNNLREVEGGINIRMNEQFVNLEGLENLEKVSNFFIGSNENITSLYGVKDIVNIEEELRVYSNESLMHCNEPWVCNHIDLNGESVISGNSDGCKTVDEIKSNCTTNTNEITKNHLILLFPNPTKHYFEIKNVDQIPLESIRIFNIYGEVMDNYKYPIPFYDISDYPSGYYYVQIKSISQLTIKKILKI